MRSRLVDDFEDTVLGRADYKMNPIQALGVGVQCSTRRDPKPGTRSVMPPCRSACQ
jgi:hypothetical protein